MSLFVEKTQRSAWVQNKNLGEHLASQQDVQLQRLSKGTHYSSVVCLQTGPFRKNRRDKVQTAKAINKVTFLLFAAPMFTDIPSYFRYEDILQQIDQNDNLCLPKKRKMSDPSNERKIYYLQKDQEEIKARLQAIEGAMSDLIQDCEMAGMITNGLLDESSETEIDDPELLITQDHSQRDQLSKTAM